MPNTIFILNIFKVFNFLSLYISFCVLKYFRKLWLLGRRGKGCVIKWQTDKLSLSVAGCLASVHCASKMINCFTYPSIIKNIFLYIFYIYVNDINQTEKCIYTFLIIHQIHLYASLLYIIVIRKIYIIFLLISES